MMQDKTNEEKKILILTEDFYPNISGGAFEQWKFSELAAQKGNEVTVITPRTEGTSKFEEELGVKIIRPFKFRPEDLPAYHPVAILARIINSIALFFFIFLTNYIDLEDYDVIYSASHLTHWIGKILSKICQKPYISFIAYTPSIEEDFRLNFSFILERFNFKYFQGERIFCRTPKIKKLLDKYSQGRASVIHGILDKQETLEHIEQTQTKILDQSKNQYDNIKLVFVGRLHPVKNPTALVDILRKLPENYKLDIIGSGPEKGNLKKKISKEDLNGKIDVLGKLSHKETLKIIHNSQALILPSNVEAYPTVAFEALALGKDVFATPVGILPDINHDRLHVSSLAQIPLNIQGNDFTKRRDIDLETLNEYSMERFTSTILSAMEELT